MTNWARSVGPWRLTALLLVAVVAAGVTVAAERARAAAGDLLLVAATGQRDYGEVDALRHRPAISADGRFVAYVPQSAGAGDPLFLRDMRAATAQQIVTPSNPTWPGFDSLMPALSGDGRYLAFASEEPTLSTEDRDPTRDIFRYDRLTGRTVLVSRASGPHGRNSEYDSDVPSISADGRFVAFTTSSRRLAPRSPGGAYLRDLRSEVSRSVAALAGVRTAGSPEISGDGRKIAFVTVYRFRSGAPGQTGARGGRGRHSHREIVLWDRRREGVELVSRASGRHTAPARQDCGEASASGSGRFVAFVSQAGNLVRGDDNRSEDVFVRDLRRDVTRLISRSGSGRRGPVGEGESLGPSISADGRYVAFLSFAPLLPEDGDEAGDVYVRDLKTGRLRLITRGLGGQPSNGRFGDPAISADGRFVAFGSTSSNFSPAVTTHRMAFFRYQLR